MKIMRNSMLAAVCLLSLTMTLGAAWTTKRITSNTGDSARPSIVADGSKIYLVWYDGTPGNYEIFFIKSTSSGATWQTAKRLTNTTGESYNPEIAVSDANVYVVWQDDTLGTGNIYFRKSTDSGTTWQTAKRLTNNIGDCWSPSIAASGSNVYVVWQDDAPGNEEIYFRKSTDGGATWQSKMRLTNNTGVSLIPEIIVNGSNVYVVWYDNTFGGNYDVYLRKSTDYGVTWQTQKRLTNNIGDSSIPNIAFSGSNVYVVWCDATPGNYEIYLRKSKDGGATWQTAKRLTNNTGGSYSPVIAASGTNVYLVWYDYTEYSTGFTEIYFRKSTDDGATWQTTENLTNNTGWSYDPVLAVNSSNVYVFWSDLTPGNYEIYLKYAPK